MPNSPITKQSVRLLVISYISSVSIVAFLLVSAQVLIQLVLLQEVHTRSIASTINGQELRTQRMFYNIILLQSPGGVASYAALTKTVAADATLWEQTQSAMYSDSSNYPATAIAALQKGKTDYIAMHDALTRIFAIEKTNPPNSFDLVRPDVGVFYIHESPYLQSLISTYTDLAKSADDYVQSVRVLEIVLFVLMILTLVLEARLVAAPAIRHLNDHLRTLAHTLELVDKITGEEPKT